MKIVVLNDKETYSDINGCFIVEIDDQLDNDPNDIEDILDRSFDGEEIDGVKITKISKYIQEV
jgi:hypothetical protein